MQYIFDIGNVILSYRPQQYLAKLCRDPQEADALYRTIFASEQWALLDAGLVSYAQATAVFQKRCPRYAAQIAYVMRHWVTMTTPIEQTWACIRRLKQQGQGLYYLSNFHRESSLIVQKTHDIFALFDGGVFSCDVHVNKPDARIYRCLLDAYALVPETCVFIDDTEANVRAAEALGMRGVVFDEEQCLQSALDGLAAATQG